MKFLFIGFCFFLNSQFLFSQTVEVIVPRSKKEADAILKKAREETRINKSYFAEDEKCRNLIRARSFAQAETSCRLAISLAEKLPKFQSLERSSSRVSLAVVMLWQNRAEEAIALLNESLEVAKTRLSDIDAETGERYFLLGQANHLLGKTKEAKEFYIKAEKTYRTAFKEMGDSNVREFYARPIVSILEAHLFLLKNAGLNEEAITVEKRLAETKLEFARFLED